MEVCPQQDVSAGLVKPEARAPGGGNKNNEQLEEKNLVREDVVMKPEPVPAAAAAGIAKKTAIRPPVLKSGRTARKLAAKKSWLAGKKHTSEKKQQYQKRSKTFTDFRKEHKGKFSEESPAIFDGPGKKSSSKPTTPFLTKQRQTALEMKDRRKVQKQKYDELSSKFQKWRLAKTTELSGKTEKDSVKVIYEVGKPVAVQN